MYKSLVYVFLSFCLLPRSFVWSVASSLPPPEIPSASPLHFASSVGSPPPHVYTGGVRPPIHTMRAMRLARCSRLVLVVCAIVVGVQLAPLPLHADTAAGTQQQPTLAQDMHQLFGGGNGLVRGNTSSLVSSSGSSPAFGAPLGAADASDEGVPMHLQSTLLNDTCTLSSQPNGSMVMTCPGCTLYVPMHYANFDVELFFSKAVNYAYVCAAVTLLQIIVTFKQMKVSSTDEQSELEREDCIPCTVLCCESLSSPLHAAVCAFLLSSQTSESPAASGRLCRFTVGMQGLLDGYQSLFHMFIAFNCEALFNAFIVTSLAQFVACFMFGSAFLHHLYKIAFPADFEGGWERAQRTRKLINLKFYTVLMTGLVIFWEVPGGFELVHFVLYGFWVPQIIWQAVHGVKRGFTTSYIVAMSATRLMLPLYFLACPVNFLHHHTEPWKVALLLAWMAAQLAVLTMQRKWGARFFVPARVSVRRCMSR